MRKYNILLFLFLSFQLSAQKIVEQIINNPLIKTIVISDDSIFKIKIHTTLSNTIKLQSKIEGEYTKDLFVSTKVKNDSLVISSHFQPYYKDKNDKLSAHKVISIELVLKVPEKLNIYFKSSIASAEIDGNYKSIVAELSQGNTSITNFNGDAIINSINGNIKIETNYATINAMSKTGIIEKEALLPGKSLIKVNTINGNISITKTKK